MSLVTQELKREETYDPDYSLAELIRLAETANVEVLGTMTQNKEYADSKWFIGKGKAQELKELLEEKGANTAIFDQELSGAQVRNLEQFLDVKIIDRTQLILDIFAGRAKTREGIIQVELRSLAICCRGCPATGRIYPGSAAALGPGDPGSRSWRRTAVISAIGSAS